MAFVTCQPTVFVNLCCYQFIMDSICVHISSPVKSSPVYTRSLLERQTGTVQSNRMSKNQIVSQCLNHPAAEQSNSAVSCWVKNDRVTLSTFSYSPRQVHVCFSSRRGSVYGAPLKKKWGPYFHFLPCATLLNQSFPSLPHSCCCFARHRVSEDLLMAVLDNLSSNLNNRTGCLPLTR